MKTTTNKPKWGQATLSNKSGAVTKKSSSVSDVKPGGLKWSMREVAVENPFDDGWV